jgi:riboflavin synthase
MAKYIIVKGSVAVDGISLTINTCTPDSFSVSIIPHTADLTTIGFKNKRDPVNIENDMIGKYVERFMDARQGRNKEGAEKPSAIDREYLLKTGFLDK